MENHLIIGLGGTGGNILCEMRKRIYEVFSGNTPQKEIGIDPASGKPKYEQIVNIAYLYVDSDEKDLKAEWKIQGEDVSLPAGSKINIHGISADVLNNLTQYKGIEAFINKQDESILLKDKDFGSLISAGIGGQRRRLGRLLFANNLCGNFNDSFIENVKATVSKMQTSGGSAPVTFHICAGLAGGTGSGSIVDAVSQIRKNYDDAKDYMIILYLYVPEKVIANATHNRGGFYQSNGYAALCELNALSVGAYKSYDVTGDIDTTTNKVRRINGDSYNKAYLFSNINENKKTLEVRSALSKAVSDFLYQKIIVSHLISGGTLGKLSDTENEPTTPEFDDSGILSRSRNFMSFGIKRIEYPEQEIKEYVANKFVLNAINQVVYNTWANGIGFVSNVAKNSVGINFSSEIPQQATLEGLMLTDDYLTLSKAIVLDRVTQGWEDVKSFWEKKSQNIFSILIGETDIRDSWLSKFNESFDKQFNESYRDNGVTNFFVYQQQQFDTYANVISKHIEKKLFTDWQNGTKSILEIEKYFDILIPHCQTILANFDIKISNETKVKEKALKEITDITIEWNNRSRLVALFTDAYFKKSFTKYKSAKAEFYICQTKIAGYNFAKALMPLIISKLNTLLTNVKELNKKFKDLYDFIEGKTNNYLSDGDNVTINTLFDKNAVEAKANEFIAIQRDQVQSTANFRNKVSEELREVKTFENLLSSISNFDATFDKFTTICQVSADATMNDFATSSPANKMIGINIFDKLKVKYPTSDGLKKFIKETIDSAKTFLEFDKTQDAKVTGTSPLYLLQLCLPDYNDTDYRNNFINEFADIAGNTGFSIADNVSLNSSINQIVVICAKSAFPLRFVDNLSKLKEAYEMKIMEEKGDLNRILLHTETFAKPLPSLFIKSIDEYKKEVIPTVLIAYATGLVEGKTNNTTGSTYNAIGINTVTGLKDWIDLGKNILESVDNLSKTPKDITRITNLIETTLAKEYVHNNKKSELQAKLAILLKDTILPLTGGEETDASFVIYRQAVENIILNQLKIN